MLPTRGACHGVFLLVHSARSVARSSVEDWIGYARTMPTVMAAALDLDGLGNSLFRSGLVRMRGGRVWLHPELAQVGDAATEEVLMRIAGLLLRWERPPWSHAALAGGELSLEFIPSADLDALQWLGEDLEPLLVNLQGAPQVDDGFKQWLGQVGESLVVAWERRSGAFVRHVSRISDCFGYDVESTAHLRRRLEVKTSVVGSEHRVYLTRNEANKAKRHRSEWFLIQVVLKPEALTAPRLTRDHVEYVRQLAGSFVIEVLPVESVRCRWLEAVELNVDGLGWVPYLPSVPVPEDWAAVGTVA